MRVIELTKQKPNGGTVRRLAVAAWPEGNVLAVVVGTESACHSVRWLNLADGSEILSKDLAVGEGVPVPALSPDLRELAYFDRDGDRLRLFLERAEKKAVRRPIGDEVGEDNEDGVGGDRYYAIAFAPNGKFLQASTDGCALGWGLADDVAGFCISEGGADGEFLAIAPSNLSVLSHSNGDCSIVNEYRNDWGGYLSSRSGGPVRGLAFSPNGRLLCVAEGHAVAVYGVPVGSEEEDENEPTLAYRLQGHAAATAIAFSPDSNTLATADEEGIIRLWDSATGKEKVGSAKNWKIGKIGALAFSPDGCTCLAGGAGGALSSGTWSQPTSPRPPNRRTRTRARRKKTTRTKRGRLARRRRIGVASGSDLNFRQEPDVRSTEVIRSNTMNTTEPIPRHPQRGQSPVAANLR